MSKADLQYLHRLVQACPPQVILQAADLCDGHSILDPRAFLEAGLPPPVVEHLTRTYLSDGSPKGNITVNGQVVKQLRGVYGLDVLEFLARALGVSYRQCLGRGFQAQAIQQALSGHFIKRAGAGPTPAA